MTSISVGTRIDNYYFDPPNFNISDEVKDEIMRNYIEPAYKKDIHLLLKGTRDWKLVGQVFETTSKALVAIGCIISFAAGFFDEYYLSFVAGAISTISLATLQFSSFGYKEQKKQGQELNIILKKLKLEEMPINERNADESIMSSVAARQTFNRYSSVVNNQGASSPQYNPSNNIREMEEAFITTENEMKQYNKRMDEEIIRLQIRMKELELAKKMENDKILINKELQSKLINKEGSNSYEEKYIEVFSNEKVIKDNNKSKENEEGNSSNSDPIEIKIHE